MTDAPYRAAIVAAVSTPAQAREERHSIPAQLAAGRDACARLEARVVAEITVPGHSRDFTFLHELVASSPEYAQLVTLVEADAVNLIVCWRYDRLWRNDWIRADLMRLCAVHNVQVYSTEQPRPPKAPEDLTHREGLGKIVEVFSALASESEQERRIQRHRLGMAGRIAKGLAHPGPTCPYGYQRDPDGRLVPDPEEAYWVRWMAEQRAVGHSAGRIAADLTRMAVPTPGARRPALRAGTTWHPRTVQRILTNPVYRGAVSWGEFTNPDGQHDPLVDPDLWDRVQALITAHRSASYDKTYSGDWLRGLLRCAYCADAGRDRAMVYYKVRRAETRLYLRCGFYVETHGVECTNNGHSAARVHHYVTERITQWLADPDAWREARAAQAHDTGHAQEHAQVREAITHARAQWDRTFRAYQLGIITANDLALHKTTLDRDLRALEAREAELARTLADTDTLTTQFTDLATLVESFPRAPYPIRARVAHTLLRAIHLRRLSPPALTLW